MTASLAERADAERSRVQAEYLRRAAEIDPDRYAPWQPAEAFMRAERRRLALRMLKEAGVFPAPGDACLEVGCGSIGWLGELVCLGLRETDLHGIDVSDDRLARARASLPGADLRQGDAAALPWPSDSFRLVVASTMMTSVLDPEVRRQIAAEITRVIAPGGALLWYDFAVDNPSNRNVRGVSRRELRGLFPALDGRARSVTLAPPIARRVAGFSWLLATFLEALPPLRTHILAVLVKR